MKKKIIIGIILLVIVIIGIFAFLKRDNILIGLFNYDILIESRLSLEPETGYASTKKQVLINTEKKVAYYVSDYYVYSPNASFLEKGHNYTILNKIKLTEDEIKNIIDEINSGEEKLGQIYGEYSYYYAEYNNNNRYLKDASTEAISRLFNE